MGYKEKINNLFYLNTKIIDEVIMKRLKECRLIKMISKCLVLTILIGLGNNLSPINMNAAEAAITDNLFNEYNGTSKQDFIKKKYLTAINNLEEKVHFSWSEISQYGIKSQDINYCYDSVLFEHPEIFYVARVNFSKQSEDDGYDVYIGYIYDKEKIPGMKNKLDEKLNEIVEKVTSYNEVRKIFEIYDYIRTNNTYAYDIDKTEFNFDSCYSIVEKQDRIKSYSKYFEAHSVYGTLINGTSVWEGYSKTLMLLLKILEFKTGIVRSGYYGWNYVVINGYYYHLRFNYEESYYEYYSNPYKYFNFSDKYISLENNWTSSNDDEIICSDTTYDSIFRKYYNKKVIFNNVVRINNKLYYLDDEYKIYSYELDGGSKKYIYNLSLNNKNVVKYMKAYKNYLYYISYEYINNKYVCIIKRYNVDTGKVEEVLNLNNKLNVSVNYEYINRINFYIYNEIIYIDYLGSIKTYNLSDLVINDSTDEYLYDEALEYVRNFEKKLTYSTYKKALTAVKELAESSKKDKLLDRIKDAKKEMNEKDNDNDDSDYKNYEDGNKTVFSGVIQLKDTLGPSENVNKVYNTNNTITSNYSYNPALPGQWIYTDGNWYHINDDLRFTTGWLKYNNSMYYFDNNGAMATGWRNIGNNTYAFTNEGVMITGWIKDDDTENWYYFQDDGAMVKGTIKCGYLFADDGRWIKK